MDGNNQQMNIMMRLVAMHMYTQQQQQQFNNRMLMQMQMQMQSQNQLMMMSMRGVGNAALLSTSSFVAPRPAGLVAPRAIMPPPAPAITAPPITSCVVTQTMGQNTTNINCNAEVIKDIDQGSALKNADEDDPLLTPLGDHSLQTDCPESTPVEEGNSLQTEVTATASSSGPNEISNLAAMAAMKRKSEDDGGQMVMRSGIKIKRTS